MYYVTKREKCQACRGNGIVDHPDWREYWRKYPKNSATLKDTRSFFLERGHFTLPSGEIACGECKGSGIIESEVTLVEALRNLGFGQLVQLPEVTK